MIYERVIHTGIDKSVGNQYTELRMRKEKLDLISEISTKRGPIVDVLTYFCPELHPKGCLHL
jgi:hypothetical protein